jgi:hypothetical protein
MSRTRRLLDLLQVLRRHRYPVTGAALADGDIFVALDPDGHRLRVFAPGGA